MAWELADNVRGPKGEKGDTGAVSSVSVATLPPDAAATVEMTGSTDVHVHFGIPRGERGNQGIPGTLSSASAESVAADQNAEVIMSGTTEVKHAHFRVPRGLPGTNAVENDEAFATYVGAPDSATRQTLDPIITAAVGGAAESSAAVARRVAAKLSGKKVAVIFRHDDVQASALAYLPTYAAREVQASWYVASGGMGTVQAGVQMASASDVQDIAAAGHEVGAHGIDYVPWSDQVTEADRRHQIEVSKRNVEQLTGAVCETFAYPGNSTSGDGPREVLDYFVLATTGVANVTTAGNENTLGTLDLAAFQAQYSQVLLDDNPALTPAKAAAWFEDQKDRPGVTVFTLQAHNTNEMSVDNLNALLDAIDADPEVTTLTVRELAHYVRNTMQSSDGRYFYAINGNTGRDIKKFVGGSAVSSGYAADRIGSNGKVIRAYVGGVEASSLDAALRISGDVDTTPSTFEKGHETRWFSPDMLKRVGSKMLNSNLFQWAFQEAGLFQIFNAALKVQGPGIALEVGTVAGSAGFRADPTRGTIWMKVLTAVPSGASTVGEMANVNGTVMVCTVAGAPGTWVAIGSQT